MERLKAHRKFEEVTEKLGNVRVEEEEKKLELKNKISDEIEATGTNELKELWSKYSHADFMSSIARTLDTLSISTMGHVIEKSMIHLSMKCSCGAGLVQDGNYTKTDKDNPIAEFKQKLNSYVCLDCRKKFKLVEA